MPSLNNSSKEKLERIREVLKIVSNYSEFGFNRLTGIVKIPLKRLEKEDIFYEEAILVFGEINEEEKEPVIEVLNESHKDGELGGGYGSESTKELERLECENIGIDFLNISKKDLEENIVLKIKNLNRLKEIKEIVDKELEKEQGSKLSETQNKKDRKSENINSITCVRPKSGNKFIIIVNNDYRKAIKGDKTRPSWDLLFRIAEGEEIEDDPQYKNNLDYFNSNQHNRLYAQTSLKITKILKREGGSIKPNIEMNVISDKAFKTRLKKREIAEK